MNMPGFTAEASLYNGNVPYQATAEAGLYGGIVQPAQSDVFYPDRQVPFLSSSIFHPRPLYCLKRVCTDVAPAGQTPRFLCHLEIGVWNPFTARCE